MLNESGTDVIGTRIDLKNKYDETLHFLFNIDPLTHMDIGSILASPVQSPVSCR